MKLSYIIHGVILYVLEVFVFRELYFELIGGLKILIFVAPLFLMLLPLYVPRMYILLLAFVYGLLVDMWCGTLGLHTSCMVTVAYFRLPIFRLFLTENELNGIISNRRTHIELIQFTLAVSALMVIYACVYFVLDYFVLAKVGISLMNGLFSGAISMVFGLIYKLILGPR